MSSYSKAIGQRAPSGGARAPKLTANGKRVGRPPLPADEKAAKEAARMAASRAKHNEKARADRLAAARERVKQAEAQVHLFRQQEAETNNAGATLGAMHELHKEQAKLARMEGRRLHPAEGGVSRADFVNGNSVHFSKTGEMLVVSKAEAQAWLNGGNRLTKRDTSSAGAKKTRQASPNRGKLKTIPVLTADIKVQHYDTPAERVQWDPHNHAFDPSFPSNPWHMAVTFGAHGAQSYISYLSIRDLRQTARAMEAHLTQQGHRVQVRGKSQQALVNRIMDVVQHYPQQPFELLSA